MKILLDTHTFLWFITDDPILSSSARLLIQDADSIRFMSIASVWEIAVKISLGKLELTRPFAELILSQLKRNHIELLPIEIPHLAEVANLPFHHRDPFDRLIISQSLVERILVVSKDTRFDEYGIQRLW
jgi:PIN domain nuclease of toxin-antitoxin system